MEEKLTKDVLLMLKIHYRNEEKERKKERKKERVKRG